MMRMKKTTSLILLTAVFEFAANLQLTKVWMLNFPSLPNYLAYCLEALMESPQQWEKLEIERSMVSVF